MRDHWEHNIELVPIDPHKTAVGVLIGNYQSSSCIARVMPHPTWRIKLSVFGRNNYHSMDDFVQRCLETIPLSPFLAARLEPEHEEYEKNRILSHGYESLIDIVPKLDKLWRGPCCDLRIKMAKAAIKEVVQAAVGWWLFSLGGPGEADIPNTHLAMVTLCQPIAKTWRKKQKEFWNMPVDERGAERAAFRENDPNHTFFDRLVDTLSEELAQAWSGIHQGEEKC
jgi:hypothetical protein